VDFPIPDFPDIWCVIFSFLSPKDVARASCACKKLRDLSHGDEAYWDAAKESTFGLNIFDLTALGPLDVAKSGTAKNAQERFGRMCFTEAFLRTARLDVPNMPLHPSPAFYKCKDFVRIALAWSKEWITDFPRELKNLYIKKLTEAGFRDLDEAELAKMSGLEVWKQIFNYDHSMLRDFPKELKRAYLNRLKEGGNHTLDDIPMHDVSGHILFENLWRLNHELLFDLPFECKRIFMEQLKSIGDTTLDDSELFVPGHQLWYKIFDANPGLLREFPLELRRVHAKRLAADRALDDIDTSKMTGLATWGALFSLNEELLGDFSELIPDEVKRIYKKRALASGDRSLVDVDIDAIGPQTRDRELYGRLVDLERELDGDFRELEGDRSARDASAAPPTAGSSNAVANVLRHVRE